MFEATKLPLTTCFLVMHLLIQAKNKLSALELMPHLGVGYKTSFLIKHKPMEVMRLRGEGSQLTELVEIDDAYLGGERSGGKPGRSSENKVSFVAAAQTTEGGQAALACFAPLPFTKVALSDFIHRFLILPLTVVSYGQACFTADPEPGAIHNCEVIDRGKASVELPGFNAVNTVLGNLKTALSGTYHSFDFVRYAHGYLAEAQYRFNRRFNLAAILPRLLRAAAVTKPQPESLPRAAEVCR